MSTALAIAATTAVLRSILNTGLAKQTSLSGILGSLTVSALPPDRITTGASEANQLNLFMYQVTPNPGWNNVGMPARDGRGDRVSNPPLALDLHYLLWAYGAADLHAEILLGYGMQLLHEMPVLTRNAIRAAFTPGTGGSLPPIMQTLATAELADQMELIKICPYTLSTEELSKLWSAFQDKYRPTAAYIATVVLIETRATTKSALPVREPKLYVMPVRHPTIDSVDPQMIALTAGAQLTMRGQDLEAPNTVVRFGMGAEQPPDTQGSSNTQLVASLPTTLLAGVNTVQVIQRLEIGKPTTLHRGFESNVAAFIVRPTIQKKATNAAEYDITIKNPTDTGNNTRSAEIVVKLSPSVGKKQRVELLLNEFNLLPPDDRPALVYTFSAKSREADAAETNPEVTFPIQSVIAGDYLARVRVDGAESSLEMDANNRYFQPKVTL